MGHTTSSSATFSQPLQGHPCIPFCRIPRIATIHVCAAIHNPSSLTINPPLTIAPPILYNDINDRVPHHDCTQNSCQTVSPVSGQRRQFQYGNLLHPKDTFTTPIDRAQTCSARPRRYVDGTVPVARAGPERSGSSFHDSTNS
ncbi:hypothetical protein K474DRAFT_866758 [Panus rudis PR-1116 ss-1]|nr:hypothetical protein K474DRAFT_866758 [Panus rudis PR-1116 ss-1]